ncbi:alpha-amlyase [Aliikangiella coralliicola]|uniref:Alpha-amlyase n=2 Tax=Aliikangiella coralliicola TaxID=2592383 RepID=A0A545UK97_9GAMM|nr:alpha-amlyase [Aliikangiella coralliicola]
MKNYRIEPPFWWAGMKDNRLQLMVHGNNISNLTVESPSKKLKVESWQSTNNPNYLFINLSLQNTPHGTYQLHFLENKKVVNTIDYQIKSRESNSANRRGFNSADVIYLITPDRFANGDSSNDEVDSLKEKLDRQNPDGRHGGDIQGVIDNLDYIHKMGFTQLWLNPVLENDQPQYSYHGYSTTDYYRIDERYGSNRLYRELSREAKRKEIGLIKDIILNHIGSEHWWMKDLPAEDWINHNAKFSPTSHKRESLHDPHGVAEDRNGFADGWFVPTMPDLNQRNPMLANYLIQNSIWWIEYADLSGIRLDTYSYSDKKFLTDYTQRIVAEYPEFTMVGEEWSINPAIVAYWQKGKRRHDDYQSDLTSLMDFPLQDALVKGLTEKDSWSDGFQKLYATIAGDFIYANPEKLVIFPDNHDMGRIFTQLKHDVALTKMALVFFATTRGIPQFFYGTEILMDNKESDSHGVIRSDFAGGWKSDKRNAFSGSGLSNSQSEMQLFMKKLLNWRKNSPVIHTGKLTHYAPQNGVYVYFRHNQSSKVMVVLNKNKGTVVINPEKFPSMLKDEKGRVGRDIFTERKYSMNKAIEVEGMSALVLDIVKN